MDIRNWSLGQIMQLPDHCFGQRWPIGVASYSEESGTIYDISEMALPESCVFWTLGLTSAAGTLAVGIVSLALGDQLPATDAEFDRNEVLFRDIGVLVAGRRLIYIGTLFGERGFPMRKLVAAGGRRLIARFVRTSTAELFLSAMIEVSSVPKEVPDWLVSR